MKKVLLLTLMIIGLVSADSYTLSLITDGTQGTTTLPTTTSLTYTHDGTEVSPEAFHLDSIKITATDAAGNVSDETWMFIRIMPVNDNAPVIESDTVVCLEGNSVTFSPKVTDKDN